MAELGKKPVESKDPSVSAPEPQKVRAKAAKKKRVNAPPHPPGKTFYEKIGVPTYPSGDIVRYYPDLTPIPYEKYYGFVDD